MADRKDAQYKALKPTGQLKRPLQRSWIDKVLDWGTERSFKDAELRAQQAQKLEPFVGPQQPWIDRFKRAIDETAGLADVQGLPRTKLDAQTRAAQAVLGAGSVVVDPADAVTAEAGEQWAKEQGFGETAQGLFGMGAGAVTGLGAGDAARAAQLLGSPEVLKKITRDVVDPIAKKFKPESETAKAMQRVLTGPRPIRVTEEAQVLAGGRPVAGAYGIPGRRSVPEERTLKLTTVGDPDYPKAYGPRRHETGHAIHEEKPIEAQHRITKATKEGKLPLNPMMVKFTSYRKLPDTIKGNENYSMWLDDFLSGKMEWDAGQLARAPENLEYKRAAKALEWFRDNEKVVLGQSIPIGETTRRWAQRRALGLP